MKNGVAGWQWVTLYRATAVVGVATLPLFALGLLLLPVLDSPVPYRRFAVMALAFGLVWLLNFRALRDRVRVMDDAEMGGEPWGWGRVAGVLALIALASAGILGAFFWPG